MLVNILNLSIDVDKIISSLIEKTNLLLKIQFVFSTSIINVWWNKNCCIDSFLELVSRWLPNTSEINNIDYQ